MRRSTALVGVATLALGLSGLAGPASAADTHDARIMVVDPILVEVAVDLLDAGPSNNIDGDYGVIENLGTADDLDDFDLRGCNATNDFSILDYGTNDQIFASPTPFHLTADNSYAGPVSPDTTGGFGSLNQSNSGVYLMGPSGLVNGVEWGTPNGCPGGLATADPPTEDESLHLVSGSWDLDTPAPRNTSSS